MQHFPLVIGGTTVPADDHLEVLNPSTGEPVGLAPKATAAQLDEAVAAASTAFDAWSAAPDAERAAACGAIADCLERNAEELAQLLTREQGKPLGGAGSRFELGGAQAWARHTAALELPVKVLQDDASGRVELHRGPLGVIGSITPWNWPLMIAIWHVVPAIRTGNTVVIKPSPQTPLSTLRMVELLQEVVPAGVLNGVAGDDGIGAAMSAHPGIAKMVFTGSTATGKKVMESAAGTIKRLTLELGGNDAGIVLDDVDPAAIAEDLFWGAFQNNGQTCAALKRLYVHADVHDAVCEALVAYARTVTVGDGLDEASVLGPVQNRMQFDKVRALVDDALERGGRLLLGGAPDADGPGFFHPITLISEVANGVALVDEEQFGPALPIIRFDDVEAALAAANDNPNGLGGSVWSGDVERARNLALRLECGSSWINKHGAIQPNAPFGGVKMSGTGVQFGVEGLEEYTAVQTLFAPPAGAASPAS